MNYTLKSWLIAGALILSVTSCATFKSTPDPSNINALVKDMPMQSTEAQYAFGEAVFAQGPEAITAICDKLVPLGTGNDTKARFALSGLAKHANRPHAGRDQKAFANTIIEALCNATDPEVKSFLIRQLQVAGKNESVETLSGYLSNETLSSPATQALQAIGTRKATDAIHAAVLTPTSDAQLITLMKALAELQHAPAQSVFEQHATHSNRDVRFTALLGLAKLARPESETTLKAATQSGTDYDKIKANALYGLYTRKQVKR